MLEDRQAEPYFSYDSPFSHYVDALDALSVGDAEKANAYLATADEASFFARHLRIALLIMEKQYERAREQLFDLLNGEKTLNEVELYTVLCELEICCREVEDYKSAYHFSHERVSMLETLLKEV